MSDKFYVIELRSFMKNFYLNYIITVSGGIF